MKKIVHYSLVLLPLLGLISSCGNTNNQNDKAMNNSTGTSGNSKAITRQDWGELDGKKVYLYTLTNKSGTEVKITNYGGIVTSWITPDKNGQKSNIVLGFDDLKGYQGKTPYFGATVGRYGNRIANGRFTLDGKEYKLATNNGKNHLHGGIKGFDKVVWDADQTDENSPSLTLHYLSKDGEEGYPGNLNVTVKFTLTDENGLGIEYDATTDKATPVNLTNHSYFNLTGDVSKSILEHTLMVDADKYTPVDATLIPTGELKDVTGTPFDFRKPKKIGAEIGQVKGGYDHNFVLNGKGTDAQRIAVLTDDISGRQLEVYTTEPGVQFYTGNFLDGSLQTSDGRPINKNTGMCLETQHFPDSPNKPNFPSTILQPGQKYHTVTRYVVGVKK
jgi:aldose 1-epimerase